MAHPEALRRAVRASYVFDQMTLEMAALTHSVAFGTVRNWRAGDKEAGDDWDKARAAQMIAGGGIEDVVRQTLGIVVQQVQAVIQQIQDATDMPAEKKVDMLAKVADSYNKLMAVSRRMMPETDKFAVATDVLKRQSEFIKTNFPQHQAGFVEMLSLFGEELAKAYG
jgi:hypothetical protein